MTAEILLSLPIGEYHGSEYVSSTKLLDLEPTPAHYHGKHIAKTIPRKTSDALDFGNAAHLLALEGREAYEAGVAIHPATYPAPESAKKDAPLIDKPWNWNANACKDWAKAQGNRLILSQAEEDAALQMVAAMMGNPDAAALLTGGKSEVTFRKHLGLFGVQCRLDLWHPEGLTLPSMGPIGEPVIADLKTCDTIERFRKDFDLLRYGMRSEFYRMVVRETLAEVGGLPLDDVPFARFFWIAQEKQAPWRCEVFEADAEEVETSRKEVHAALATLAECMRTNIWPGAKPGVQRIGRTEWQMRRAGEKADAVIERRAA